MPLTQLRRVRWAVRATLTLGVAASVVANILHARDNPISQAIAAWPPLALLLTVELISRVPVHRRSLAFARLAATAIIAGIAAWVSYWHMVGVAARYGETGASPYLLPLSVDGLIVVASICLVELGGRISATQAAASSAQDTTAAGQETTAAGQDTPASETAPARDRATSAVPAGVLSVAARSAPAAPRPPVPQAAQPAHPALAGAVEPIGPIGPVTRIGEQVVAVASPGVKPVAAAKPRRTSGASRKPASPGRAGKAGTSGRPRRPIAETAALAAAIQAERPEATDADVAQELGITPARLRAIRREVRDLDLAA
ncbi:DUF2637 domain-containing protein [Plantactinospora sp. WMMB334]|uniref:DUF2637 domain-containing protein n=1 Tax=Plantactinospora sp. WMMB334 TaxID=3404119 RepID=UPI003B95C402